MRLHVANPNATPAMTDAIAMAARSATGPGVEIVATTNETGPPAIEGPHDGAMAVPGLLDIIRRQDAEPGTAAHVIACFDDTGLDAARCTARAPVVGIGEAACLAACQLAPRFVIVTAQPVSVQVITDNLRRTGLGARCEGVRAAGMGVLEIEGARGEAALERALGSAARDHPGAALVLGCAGMAPLATAMSERLDRPVVDGVRAAVALAEGLGRQGLATMRAGAYPLSRDVRGRA